MVVRSAKRQQVRLTWKEVSEALSKAGVLTAREDVKELTLIKPRILLIHTVQVKEDGQ